MIEQHTGEHIPGLAELAIQEAFKQTSKPKRFSWRTLIKLPHRKRREQIEQNSKPVNRAGRASKLERVNKTSRVQVEFSSLAKLETGLQWVENLIHILTPRLLVVGFVVSMVDLLTHGGLLNIPYMIYFWAFVQAMAVDATLPNMWRLAFTRFDERRFVAGGFLLIIGLALGLVVFAALSIQFLQQAENLTLDRTMQNLGINTELLTYVRSGSVVLLAAVLSVLNRTVSSKHRMFTQAENRIQNSEQNTEQRTESPSEQQPVNRTEQNTEPLQFSHKPKSLHVLNGAEPVANSDSLVNGEGSKQERILALLEEDPEITVTQISRAVGVSKGYASQQRARFLEGREA
jgi:hypothetical protein